MASASDPQPTPPAAEEPRGVPLAYGLAVLVVAFVGLVVGVVLGLRPSRSAAATTAPAAPPAKPLTEIELRALLAEPARLTHGEQVFLARCAACHSPAGAGIPNLGPNLTDNAWLHGSDMADIVRVIEQGVPGKVMVAWKGQLSADEIHDVAAFIVTLKDTMPGAGKAPEGELKPITYWPLAATPAPAVETVKPADATAPAAEATSKP